MNSIAHALKVSGMTLPPLNKRIWLWLKDHPEKTAEEIATALGEKLNTVSAQMTNLRDRDMLIVFKDKSRKQGMAGIQYMVSRYTVKHKVWEMLPRKHMKAKAPEAAPALRSLQSVSSSATAKAVAKVKATQKASNGYTTTPITPEIAAMIDVEIREIEESMCIQMSRSSFIAMVVKKFARGRIANA